MAAEEATKYSIYSSVWRTENKEAEDFAKMNKQAENRTGQGHIALLCVPNLRAPPLAPSSPPALPILPVSPKIFRFRDFSSVHTTSYLLKHF